MTQNDYYCWYNGSRRESISAFDAEEAAELYAAEIYAYEPFPDMMVFVQGHSDAAVRRFLVRVDYDPTFFAYEKYQGDQ